MTHDEAAAILARAIVEDMTAFVTLTTAPDDEQRSALQTVDQDRVAPDEVCSEMDIDLGSTWGAVVRELAKDDTGISDEEWEHQVRLRSVRGGLRTDESRP